MHSISAKPEVLAQMKKQIAESTDFNYLSKSILASMNAIEDLTGKMFQETNKETETKFWAAHDAKDITALRKIKGMMDYTIDLLRG